MHPLDCSNAAGVSHRGPPGYTFGSRFPASRDPVRSNRAFPPRREATPTCGAPGAGRANPCRCNDADLARWRGRRPRRGPRSGAAASTRTGATRGAMPPSYRPRRARPAALQRQGGQAGALIRCWSRHVRGGTADELDGDISVKWRVTRYPSIRLPVRVTGASVSRHRGQVCPRPPAAVVLVSHSPPAAGKCSVQCIRIHATVQGAQSGGGGA